MPKPSLRMRSRKRHTTRLHGSRTTTHYTRKKNSFSRCALCYGPLSGFPRLTPSKLRKLPASQRRLKRMYGGQLCHNCLRDLLKRATRGV